MTTRKRLLSLLLCAVLLCTLLPSAAFAESETQYTYTVNIYYSGSDYVTWSDTSTNTSYEVKTSYLLTVMSTLKSTLKGSGLKLVGLAWASGSSTSDFSYDYSNEVFSTNSTISNIPSWSPTATLYAVTETLPISITASAYPTDGGTVSGAGYYDTGDSVTLTATPSDNYKFVKWQDASGNEKSTNQIYTFPTSTSQNFVAVFEQVTTSASVSPTSASFNKLTATDGLSFTLLLPSGVTLTSIYIDNNYPLTEGTQYTVTGNVYKISKSELCSFASGTHSLNFKLSDGSVLSAEITISNGFTVSPDYLNFGSAAVGYTQPAGQSVTITNTSSETITISLNSELCVDFDVTRDTATIAAGGTATVTVRPKAGLAVGNHSGALQINASCTPSEGTENTVRQDVIPSFKVEAISVTVDMGGISLSNKTYDGAEITYTGAASGTTSDGTYTGGFDYEWYDSDGNKLTAAPTDAGTYTLKAVVTADGYTGTGEKTVTISPAKLTITALDKSAYVGNSAPSLASPAENTDYTVTGLVTGDSLTTAPTLAYETTPDMSKAGTYAIKASGADAGDNYTIEYKDGTLTVSEKTTPKLTLTPSKSSLSGGGTITLTVSGLPEGAAATVTCGDSSITVTGSGSSFKVTLPNATKTYTFTATYAGDETHNAATASCRVSVTYSTDPATGDTANLALWATLLLASAAGIAGVIVLKKRKTAR